MRTTAEKKELLVISKQVTNYDLSDKGRSSWTPDSQQPGYGNFCYGTRTVSSIDSATPTTGQPGRDDDGQLPRRDQQCAGVGNCAGNTKRFPAVADGPGERPGVATLTDTTNGWSVTSGPLPNKRAPATNADGSIVQ